MNNEILCIKWCLEVANQELKGRLPENLLNGGEDGNKA